MDGHIPEATYKFERIEKKFRLSVSQCEALLPVLEKYMNYDDHGVSTVCSIYYDTPDFALIRRSIERPKFKEKIRIRSYGVPDDNSMVFVEIKRKLDGIGYKRRVCLPYDRAKALMQGQAVPCDNMQIAGEILDLVNRYHPRPAVCLTYHRVAMYGRYDPLFRVTIDRDLNYTTENLTQPGQAAMNPVFDDKDWMLMEIKAPGAIPPWLNYELSRLKIYQAPFSKVGTCYMRHIARQNKYMI